MRSLSKNIAWPGGLLLAAFLLGGVLAPTLHTVQHGLEWAETRTAAIHACDHAAHAATFEDAHAVVNLDICLFCLHRIKAPVEGVPGRAALAALSDSFVPIDVARDEVTPRYYGARAPPPST